MFIVNKFNMYNFVICNIFKNRNIFNINSIIMYISLISSIIVIQEIYAYSNSDTNYLPNIFPQNNDSNKKNNLVMIDYPTSNLTNLSDNNIDSIYPDIAAFGNNVYVIYQEFVTNKAKIEKANNYDIFFIKSEDNGKTFNKPVNLSNTTNFSERPQIAVSEKSIFIVWVDQTSSKNKEIFFTRSLDNGKTFDKKINLSNNSGISNYPEISVFNENVYVVWRDTKNPDNKDSTIIFKNSIDYGKTFNNAIELTEDTYNSYPKINSYKDNVVVVWNNDGDDKNTEDNLNNSNRGMFFVQSFDRGFNFEPIVNLDTKYFGESQIAIDKNNILIVWGGNLFK